MSKKINLENVNLEKIPSCLRVTKPIIRTDSDGNVFLEFECKNFGKYPIYNLKSQLRFYDNQDNFIGFEQDEHEDYIDVNKRWALGLYAEAPDNTSYATVEIVAKQESVLYRLKNYSEIVLASIGLIVFGALLVRLLS